MRVGTKRKFRPGELAPITGVYLVHHGVRHRERHEVVIIRGEALPTCRTCKLSVSFEIVQPISHVTHDWDFSGPSNLVVRRKDQNFHNFRIFHRGQIQLPVTLRLSSSSRAEAEAVRGYSSDLGVGGLAVVVRNQLPLPFTNETVQITLEHGRDSLAMPARLRYSSGLRHGFEFLNVGPKEREIIRRILSRQNSRAVALTG